METAEQGTKELVRNKYVHVYLSISTILPHTHPLVRSQEGKKGMVCQFLGIDVWVSILPAHVNSVLLNATFVRKPDTLLKHVDRIGTKQVTNLPGLSNTELTTYMEEGEVRRACRT